MSSVLFLEQEGSWRTVALASLLLLAAIPILPLWTVGLTSTSVAVGGAFWQSLETSARIALGSSIVGLAVGLPLGVGSALAKFPGRRLILVLCSLPLVVPSFLWAIGWSTLASHFSPARPFGSGMLGCFVVAATATTPLVMFASYAAALDLSRSQIEAALLAGGERTLLRTTCRHALRPAILAGALGAVLTLSDPAPGRSSVFIPSPPRFSPVSQLATISSSPRSSARS